MNRRKVGRFDVEVSVIGMGGIVLSGRELHVYHNAAANPRPKEKRLWSRRNYRRLKQCHNYYSP